MIEKIARDELDRDVPIPLYFQVSQILRREIETGRYLPGENIPTEFELQERFHVSRATIRQAISELVYQGMLERRRSKGTSVAVHPLEGTLYDLASFTNEMLSKNHIPTAKVMDFAIILPPDVVSDLLQLRPGEMVAFMERVRYADGKPVAVEKWYAPLKYFPTISKDLFKDTGPEQSTYFVLQKVFNIQMMKAFDTMSSVGLEARDARLLNSEAGLPVLYRTRLTFDADHRPVTYSSGVFVNKLNITLEANKPPNYSS